MSGEPLDLASYRRLLQKTVPVVIESEEENDRMLNEIRALQEKQERSRAQPATRAGVVRGKQRAEDELLKLLVLLVEDFEDRRYALKRATPAEALRELLRSRGKKPKDLWDVFGSRGITSEVLRGKRAISKEKAKALAELFNVPVDLFI